MRIAVNDGQAIQSKTVEELLPFSFVRQRQKIQAAHAGKEASEVIG